MTMSFPNESADYRAARERLLADEIALRRAMESVAESRRALPKGGLVPEDYVFEGMNTEGKAMKIRLSGLFAPGTDTLVIYNFMFPRHPQDDRPGAEHGPAAGMARGEQPCPSCTVFIDQLDAAAPHVEEAGVNFVVVAKAPIERIEEFASDRGWRYIRLLSSAGNSFKRDYHAEDPDGSQQPMMTVFKRDTDGIRHFWSSELMFAPADPGQDPRHNGTLEPLWNLLDLTPKGRERDFQELIDYHCCDGHDHDHGDHHN